MIQRYTLVPFSKQGSLVPPHSVNYFHYVKFLYNLTPKLCYNFLTLARKYTTIFYNTKNTTFNCLSPHLGEQVTTMIKEYFE